MPFEPSVPVLGSREPVGSGARGIVTTVKKVKGR